MINLLRGWVWVSELFVGLAMPIALTVPAQARYRKRLELGENHDPLSSKEPVYCRSTKIFKVKMYGNTRHFFQPFAHSSVKSKQQGISFLELTRKSERIYLISNAFEQKLSGFAQQMP
jgi:hypothetical protein